MGYFMSETSRSINSARDSINHVYGGRFKSTLITNPSHFAVAYKYVSQNPLRAHLTTNLVNYKYTTHSSLYGFEKSIIPISPHLFGLDCLVPELGEKHLSWIHNTYTNSEIPLIKKALSRRTFNFPKNNNNGKIQSITP